MLQTIDIPIAHIDDPASLATLIDALRGLHGPAYDFHVGRWKGKTPFPPAPGRVSHRFIIAATAATVTLEPGDLVRGPAPDGPYRLLDAPFAEVLHPHQEPLWPGDVVTNDERTPGNPVLHGQGVYFEVITEPTEYRTPRLVMLRHLPDQPGGCAAYPGAFRREALPPQRPAPAASDQRGANRVNEHTLDMRFDRVPPPSRHYHSPVPIGPQQWVNHSETAIVLPRAVYGLPEVAGQSEGHVVIYRRPAEDPRDQMVVPVRPGSIVVTPATTARSAGHCFENAFAMLVAIPGFVSPTHRIETT